MTLSAFNSQSFPFIEYVLEWCSAVSFSTGRQVQYSVLGRGDPIESVFAEKIRFHFISTTICAPVFTIIFVAVLIHARHVLIINKKGIRNPTHDDHVKWK